MSASTLRILKKTPQSLIVRTITYTKYCLDEFPTGTNAIVAVLAYTGYDMEDAMILNKSSVERGLSHGSIYQTESFELKNLHTGENVVEVFAKSVHRYRRSSLDSDGLPFVRQIINPKAIMYSTFNTSISRTRFAEMKGSEPSFIDYVANDGSSSTELVQKVAEISHKPRKVEVFHWSNGIPISLLTASTIRNRKRAVREISGLPPVKPSKTYTCHACNTGKGMKTVAMPYVFRYLADELAAMNVNMSLSLKKRTKAREREVILFRMKFNT